MDKATGLALLAAGIALITFSVSDALSSSMAWSLASMPTDTTMWLLFGGCIEAVAGIVMTVKSFDRE